MEVAYLHQLILNHHLREKQKTLMSPVCQFCIWKFTSSSLEVISAYVEVLTINHILGGKLEHLQHYLPPVTISTSPDVFCKRFQTTEILSLNVSFEEL